MKFDITESFDKQAMLKRVMGPNAVRFSEELTNTLPDFDGARILDLGCGMGLSTVLLQKKYPHAQIVAADLWIDPTDNAAFFAGQGVSALPLCIDATQELPFAKNYFDLLFSVDSYHYFGSNSDMLPKLLAHVKPGGMVAVAVPGLLHELDAVPEEMQPFWQPDMNFHTAKWWYDLWEKAGVCGLETKNMQCHTAAWAEWLQSENEYAKRDVDMMRVEQGNYFATVQMVAGKAK